MDSAGPLFYPKTCAITFRCTLCGKEAQATFHDPDAFSDSEDEPIRGRNSYFQKEAWKKAQRTLEKKAQFAASLAACPFCKNISTQAQRKAYLKAAFPLFIAVPIILPTLTMLFGVLFSAGRLLSFALAFCAVFLLSAIVVFFGQRRRLSEARKSTHFDR